MKSGVKCLWIFSAIIFSIAFSSAIACDLTVSMINQDPYPATPGDYVKMVFQVDGVANPECGTIYFDLIESYPIIFDPGQSHEIVVESGNYNKNFNSYLIAPYKVRVDSDALNGDNPIEVKYRYSSNLEYETKQFNLNVRNNEADFEVYIKNYETLTHQIIFEILNVGEEDIEALTVEIEKQDNIKIKGPNTNIVGDLDSNEYTTADFEAIPQEGEIKVRLHYTDSSGERRTVEEVVNYYPEYFQDRITDKKSTSIWAYLFWIIVIAGIIYFFYKRYKKKKKQRELHRR